MAQVLVLATLATKRDEAAFLLQQLTAYGVSAQIIDISLETGGRVLAGDEKCLAMVDAADRVLAEVTASVAQDAEVLVGIGGGTGGEIVLQVMRSLPISFPKILATTLPFDPRYSLADNQIILVPTLADVAGLNQMLRDTFENTALMAAGLCNRTRKGELPLREKSIGITALGATEGAVSRLLDAFSVQGRETSVFHANGFGGAAFARFADLDAFNAIIDLTPHELTRIHLAGAHVNMPTRFKAGADLPRVVLPGAMNFIGLGEKPLVPSHYLERPHYQHSALFTHVKLTPDEMVKVSSLLAEAINALTGPCHVILPMGGFSHHDRPGGAIEDPDLRAVCADTLTASLDPSVFVTQLDCHLFDAPVTDAILSALPQ